MMAVIKLFSYILLFVFLYFVAYVHSQDTGAFRHRRSPSLNITHEDSGVLRSADNMDEFESGILKYNETDVRPRPPEPTFAPRDDTRRRLPRCPTSCEDGWIGDEWCDNACNIEECAFDDGDCDGWCSGECRPGWQNDTQCDLQCYNAECLWDGGECAEYDEKRALMTNAVWNFTNDFDFSFCNCPVSKLSNNKCDNECNTFECNQDAQDCHHDCNDECPHMWLGDGSCDFACDKPECHYDKGDCSDCSLGCRTWKLGNGICDQECHNEACGNDQGDCEDIAHVARLDYNATPFIYEFCAWEFIGDGYCDLACNNTQGKWDGGDCSEDNSIETGVAEKNETEQGDKSEKQNDSDEDKSKNEEEKKDGDDE